ncbi:hypothetical protein BWZ20_03375 [Winogradskyella sp. J14-2]|uniref:hypothetical protein n=1 Tax=Winogradskyella sp. J14-2 TaxID=1936080 RepID=UPI0009726C70|nr:hypothetical protein [Winogradskyella sp. J14-2]APY07398.1 hypothetical protein BWZ20_03375 [Winogradskyella sp. J14-2]
MKRTLLLAILSLSTLLGCEEPLCIFPKEPELPNKQFPIGNTEDYYYVDLDAEINNEPRDNDYDYYFDVEGLPLGMDYFVNFRTISLEGTPEEAGIFEITIFLEVDGPFRNDFDDNVDDLCSYRTSKTYTLIIE